MSKKASKMENTSQEEELLALLEEEEDPQEEVAQEEEDPQEEVAQVPVEYRLTASLLLHGTIYDTGSLFSPDLVEEYVFQDLLYRKIIIKKVIQ